MLEKFYTFSKLFALKTKNWKETPPPQKKNKKTQNKTNKNKKTPNKQKNLQGTLDSMIVTGTIWTE